MRIMLLLFKFLYQRLMMGEMRKILLGRAIERERPERGRFLLGDLKTIHQQTWRNLEELLPQAKLEDLPTAGNLHNAFLAVLTIAGFHAFLSNGIEKEYAIELFADVGWKLYTKFIPIPRFFASLVTRDPQKQINFILRSFMRFPFSAPGRPGYEVKAWSEINRFCTFWTNCPPFNVIKSYVERNGDKGEIEAFYKTWCAYDWALSYAMLDGAYGVRGHFERPHTISLGDEVCDMCWYAIPPQG
jgi:hypothetical protein